MNWNDTIVLTVSNPRSVIGREQLKIAILRKDILSLSEYQEKDYSTSEIRNIARILVPYETAERFGFSEREGTFNKEGVYLPIKEEFQIVLGLLRGSIAAEVLFQK